MNKRQMILAFTILIAANLGLWMFHKYSFPRQRPGVLRAFELVETHCSQGILYKYENQPVYQCGNVTFTLLNYDDIQVKDGEWQDTISERYKGMLKGDIQWAYYKQEFKKWMGK